MAVAGSIINGKLVLLVGILVVLFNLCLGLVVVFVLKNYFVTIDLDNRLKISIDDLQISTQINEKIDVLIDSTITIPINTNFEVPIAADILIDEVFDIETNVPISIVLTENEMQMGDIEIPIETDFPIDEIVVVNTTIPIDTTIRTYAGVPIKVRGNLPINIEIPIKQNIHVKKNLVINLSKFRLALDMTLPIKTKVAVKQLVGIENTVPINIAEKVSVEIKAIVPINVIEPFQTQIGIGGSLSVSSGSLILDYDAIDVDKKQ